MEGRHDGSLNRTFVDKEATVQAPTNKALCASFDRFTSTMPLWTLYGTKPRQQIQTNGNGFNRGFHAFLYDCGNVFVFHSRTSTIFSLSSHKHDRLLLRLLSFFSSITADERVLRLFLPMVDIFFPLCCFEQASWFHSSHEMRPQRRALLEDSHGENVVQRS